MQSTYIYASLRMAMPTTHRTNDHTTHSLALTNGSTFGELLLLVMMCVNICRRLFALYDYFCTKELFWSILWLIFICTVLSPVRVRQSESLLEAHVSRVCIRGVRGAIGTAITSVVGYADPPGDGPPQITSVTLYDCLFDLWRVF